MNRILVVDDDPHIREVVQFALDKEGFDTLEAGDGAQALERFATERPDLIVLDITMPELDGTEVCRRGATVIVYDQAYGEAQPRDRLGRDLPQWQGCRVIAGGEIFLMNWDAADSLDGRYFGPLPRTSITARVTPIWIDEYGDGRFRWRFTDPALEP